MKKTKPGKRKRFVLGRLLAKFRVAAANLSKPKRRSRPRSKPPKRARRRRPKPHGRRRLRPRR